MGFIPVRLVSLNLCIDEGGGAINIALELRFGDIFNVWFGLQSFRQSAGNPGSPQGSPQHRGVEEDETLDGYP